MDFSENTISIVQSNWGKLSAQVNELGDEFYTQLFVRYPHYRQYFGADFRGQSEKFVTMINLFVNGLEYWDDIEEEIIQLGQRHRLYGNFNVEDFENLIDTLITVLMNYTADNSDQIEKAWFEVTAVVAETMIEALGAREPQQDHGMA